MTDLGRLAREVLRRRREQMNTVSHREHEFEHGVNTARYARAVPFPTDARGIPTGACRSCGGRTFWKSADEEAEAPGWRCRRCSPPDPADEPTHACAVPADGPAVEVEPAADDWAMPGVPPSVIAELREALGLLRAFEIVEAVRRGRARVDRTRKPPVAVFRASSRVTVRSAPSAAVAVAEAVEADGVFVPREWRP